MWSSDSIRLFAFVSLLNAFLPHAHAAPAVARAPKPTIYLDTLDLSNADQQWGTPHAGQTVEGSTITLGGIMYAHGFGTHAQSELTINLKGAALRFEAIVGLDDERKNRGAVQFIVRVDDRSATATRTLRGDDAQPIVVDLTGAKKLTLIVND